MKKSEVLPAVMAGKVMAVAEYRTSVPNEITKRDEATGRTRSIKMVKHNVELGGNAVAVTEWMKDDVSLVNYKSPFKKGDMVVVTFKNFQEAKGSLSGSGTLEALSE